MDYGRIRRPLFTLLSGILAACSSEPARAQAWLPPQGEAWFSIGYGNVFVTKHYFGNVNPGEIDAGHIRGQSIAMQLGYGLTDRFALSVSLPYVISKYYGPFPHPTNLDNGQYHGTFQDYRINLGYQLFNRLIAVAPFATAVIPSHSYQYYAHSAPGRDLHEYQLGVSAGSRLDRIISGTYWQATYSYAFVERVAGIHHDRSDVALEAGYFLTPELSARLLGTGYYTHGGIVFHSPFDLPPELFPHHDQIGHSSEINLGGGLAYVLTGSTVVYASYFRSVYGRDSHKIDHGLNFGVGWSFSPAQLVRRYFPSRSASS